MKAQYIELVLRAFEARHDMASMETETMLRAVKLANFLKEQLKFLQETAQKFALIHAEVDEDGKLRIEQNVTRQPQLVFKSGEDRLAYEKRMIEINETEIGVPDALKLTQHDIGQFKFTFGELHYFVDLLADR